MKKSKLIAISGIIISIIVIIALVSSFTRPYLKVSQVYVNPSRYDNQEIQVIGIVQGYSGENFNLTENEYSILVDVTDISVPSELENGKEVVVTGKFNSSFILRASQILTQCS